MECSVTGRMLLRAYILLAVVNVPTSWETRQQSRYAAENIKRPGSGAPREYDLRFANFLPAQTLPVMHFMPQTRNEFPPAVLNRIFRQIGNTSLQKHMKLQNFIEGPMCKRMRSVVRPERVDQVRPGDIDVIAAFGDSVTAGTALAARTLAQTLVTNRGLSWTGGGQSTWRQFLTLPNIFKEMNPNLIGYATGDTLYSAQHQNQHLNLAEAAALVDDLPLMAEMYVYKLRDQIYANNNFSTDWKLVSIMVGSVDYCLDLCFWKNPNDAPKHFTEIINQTLTYLLNNSPRTIVLFITSPHIPRFLRSYHVTPKCSLLLRAQCPCVFADAFRKTRREYDELVDRVIDAQIAAASDPRFQHKNDFRVVSHPLLLNITMPYARNGFTDTNYLAPDCFHLSQRSHAAVARALWNSLITGVKQMDWSENLSNLKCATDDDPFIKL